MSDLVNMPVAEETDDRSSKPAAGDTELYVQSVGASMIDAARISVMGARLLIKEQPRLIDLPGEDLPTIHDCLDEAMLWLDAARAQALLESGVPPTSIHIIPGAGRQPTREQCQICGCTEMRACVTEDGPCHWMNEEHTLCSRRECVDAMMEMTT